MKALQLNPAAPSWTPGQPYLQVRSPEVKSFASVLKIKAAQEVKNEDADNSDPGWYITSQWDVKSSLKIHETTDDLYMDAHTALEQQMQQPEAKRNVPSAATSVALYEVQGDRRAEDQLRQRWMELARQKKDMLMKSSHSPQGTKAESRSGSGWHNVLSLAHQADVTSYVSTPPTACVIEKNMPSRLLDDVYCGREAVETAAAMLESPSLDSLRESDQSVFVADDIWTAIHTGQSHILDKILRIPFKAISFDWRRLRWNNSFSTGYDHLVGGHPLHLAVQLGRSECVQLLVAAGADIECKDRSKRTPLLLACAMSDLESMKLLVNAGASLDVRDKDANGPLHYAAGVAAFPALDSSPRPTCPTRGGAVMQWLCQKYKSRGSSIKRSKINARNKQLDTALLVATRSGRIDAAMCLLQGGADPTYVNQVGEDAVCVASRHGYNDVLGVMLTSNHKKAVGKCSSNNPHDRRKGQGPSPKLCPLLEAVLHRNVDSVSFLVLCGADITDTNKSYEYMTALMFACKQGNPDMVRLLLSSGNQLRTGVNAVDSDGLTAVCHAFIGGNVHCVQQLIAYDPSCVKFCNRYRDNETILEAMLRYSQRVAPDKKLEVVQSLPVMIRYGCSVSPGFVKKVCGLLHDKNSYLAHTDKFTTAATPASEINSMRAKGRYSRDLPYTDVTLECGDGARYACHGFILSVYSSKFRLLLYEANTTTSGIRPYGEKKLCVESCCGDSVDMMLHWMYYGEILVDISEHDILQKVIALLTLACEFGIQRLQRLCEHRLCTLLSTLDTSTSSFTTLLARIGDLTEKMQLDHLKYMLHNSTRSGRKNQPITSYAPTNSTPDKFVVPAMCSPIVLQKAIRFNALGYGKCGVSAFVADRALLERVISHRLRELKSTKQHLSMHMATLKQCLQNFECLGIPLTAVVDVLFNTRDDHLLRIFISRHMQFTSDVIPVLRRLRGVLLACFTTFEEFVDWIVSDNASCPYCDDKVETRRGDKISVTVADLLSDDFHRLIMRHTPLLDTLRVPCDVIINCSEGLVTRFAHRAMLASCSTKLASLIRLNILRGDWDGVLYFPELSALHCECIIYFAYTGSIPWKLYQQKQGTDIAVDPDDTDIVFFDDVCKLLVLADEYLIEPMLLEAELMMISVLTPENCHAAIAVAQYIQRTNIMKAAASEFLTHYHSYMEHYSAVLNTEKTAEGRADAAAMISQLNETCENALTSLIA